MYLALATADVWEIGGDFTAADLFKSLPHICVTNDILIVGSYWVASEIQQRLIAIEVKLSKQEKKPFSHAFAVNKSEYPEGRYFSIRPEKNQLQELSTLSKIPKGGVEKDLFFDHLLLYRQGNPCIPLLYFHDAFMGGTLYLSGHYSEDVVCSFAKDLKASFRWMHNPDLRIDEPKA